MPALPPLTRHGHDVVSVSSLLGTGENDVTSVLGWTLRHSPRLRQAFLAALDSVPAGPVIKTDLEVPDQLGRTDLELQGSDYGVTIEAKRGWQLPTVEQLAAYAPHVQEQLSVAHLVTLSDCSPEWAPLHLPDQVAGEAALIRTRREHD